MPGVLQVCEPTHAGAARVTFNLADQLRHWDFQSTVCTPPGELAEWCQQAGIPTLLLPFSRRDPDTYRKAFRVVGRAARTPGTALVHAHSSFSGAFARTVRRPSGQPLVFQPHAWSFLAAHGVGRTLAVAVERRLATRTDLLVCVSDEEHALAQQAGLHPRDMVVIPNGVPFEITFPARSGPRPLAPVVGCVARLTHQKGVDVLVRAVADDRWPADARVEVVGDGPLRAELAALIVELGVENRIALVGHLPDTRQQLESWDLVISPARYEGASLAVLEAIATGVPLICTDVAGIRDLIAPGRAPVPIDDPGALARATATALDDWPATQHGATEVRAHAATRFSLEAQARRTAQAYRELLRLV